MKKTIKAMALAGVIGIGSIAAYAQAAPTEVQTVVLEKPGESKDVIYKYAPDVRYISRTQKRIMPESLLAATISVELKVGTYLHVNPAFKQTFPSINCNESKPYDGIVTTAQSGEKPTTASWEIFSKDKKHLFGAANGAKLIFVRIGLVRDSVMPFFKVPETGTYEIRIFGLEEKGFEDKAVISYSLEEPQNPCVPPPVVTPDMIGPE